MGIPKVVSKMNVQIERISEEVKQLNTDLQARIEYYESLQSGGVENEDYSCLYY